MRHGQPAVLLLSALAFLMVGGCRSSQTSDEAANKATVPAADNYAMPGPVGLPEPKAVVYRTSGDCPELVPVTLTASGSGLLSYPSPTDLTSGSEPVALAEGWWLDRRGISATSRFTTYTYSDYRAMKAAPTPEEILSHLNSDCVITEIRQLPMSLSEALSDTSAVNRILRADGGSIPGSPKAAPLPDR